MTDYFDELNCTPVAPEDTANHQFILIARFMQQNGFLSEELRREQLAPPASKELVRALKEKKVSPGDERCAICLKPNEESESAVFKILPCSHEFHDTCILPWLEKVTSIPYYLLCEYELYFSKQILFSRPILVHYVVSK